MVKNRSEIEEKYKWQLSEIYKTEEDFMAEISALEERIKEYGKYEGKVAKSAEEMYSALSEYTDISVVLDRLWTYAALGFYVDMSDSKKSALETRVRNLAAKLGEATWFLTPEIVAPTDEVIEGFYSDYPALEEFRRTIYMSRRFRPHMLSDECEKMYSTIEDCLHLHSGVRSVFANSDLRYGKIRDEDGKLVELTDANYASFLMSGERRVRRAAFCTMYRAYTDFGNTFANMYSNHIKEYTTLARLRGFESSIVKSTFDDELTPVIYNNLIDTVGKNLDKLYDYYALKKEILGLDNFHLYDVYTPIAPTGGRSYTYEEAREETLGVARIFGDEYYNTLYDGLYNRGWVDVFPSRGKRSGAFSSGTCTTEPYILTNFNGEFDDISTLVHEAGHSMHSYYSRGYNKPQDAYYTLFVAEVASTVNELIFLHQKVKGSKSRDEKLYVLNQLMELYKSTLFRQTMLAEFERDIHAEMEAGEPLTREKICNTYYEIVKKYFGDGVVCDKQIAYEWARIPHFYTCFYVYKYATSISAASAIVKRLLSDGEYAAQYIEFLKCGGSRSPLESLKVAGIDLADPAVIESAIESFSSVVAEFKRVYFEK